jgi:hypothetical protein
MPPLTFRKTAEAPGPVGLPHLIMLQSFGAGGKEMVHVVYNLDRLETNRPIAAGVFSLDTGNVEKIWDSDRQTYTKYTNPRGITCAEPSMPALKRQPR